MRNYNFNMVLSSIVVMSMIFAVLGLPYKSTFFENGIRVLWNQDSETRTVYKSNPEGEGNNWLYQLQNPDIDEILESDYGHIIIDYSRDGTGDTEHSKQEITRLKDNGVVAFAYLSIGEAEDYRFYWKDSYKDAPWLGIENKNWDGNYKARYWEKDWQDLIYDYLDRILASGYSGIYMDIVDGYYYWGDLERYGEIRQPSDPKNMAEAAQRMIQFINELSDYAKEKDPNFLIVSQNAVQLLNYDEKNTYMNSIDGLGIESLWYWETEKREPEEISERLDYIRQYFKSGKFVVVTDYVDDGTQSAENIERIKIFINNCKKEGYNYFIGNKDRALDVLK